MRLSNSRVVSTRIFTMSAILLLLGLPANIRPVLSASQAQTREFSIGDVLVSVGNGQVQWRDSSGNLIGTLDTKVSGETTGLAFNMDNKNLYVTNFGGNAVSIFNSSGNLIGQFGSGYNKSPESILFDQKGNVYVGQAYGSGTILKFDSAGILLAQFQVEENRSDWIDLAPDQCMLYYTSEGKNIKQFDVCSNQALPDFATGLPGTHAFALRLLPGGALLVADSQSILKLDKQGNITQEYNAPGRDDWFALNLDPDGKSFWSATTQEVFKFDIATGSQLLTFNAGANTSIGGLAIVGEITAVQPTPISLPPPPKAITNKLLPIIAGVSVLGILVFLFRAIPSLPKGPSNEPTRTHKRNVEGEKPVVKVLPHPDMGQQKVEPGSTQSNPEIRLSLTQGQVDYLIEIENAEHDSENES